MNGRPYTAPLVRSIAAPGGRLVPSRSHGVEQATTELVETEFAHTLWSAFLGTIGVNVRGPVQSSGPAAGLPTRHAIGTAYLTPLSGWKLSGVADGWSRPMIATPSRQPTTKLALGRGWLPFGSSGAQGAPLPGLPEPARMVQPRLR